MTIATGAERALAPFTDAVAANVSPPACAAMMGARAPSAPRVTRPATTMDQLLRVMCSPSCVCRCRVIASAADGGDVLPVAARHQLRRGRVGLVVGRHDLETGLVEVVLDLAV